MSLEETIARIEGCADLLELKQTLQDYIESKGFSEFSFIDNSWHGSADPLIINSITESWESDYRSNGFLDVDPCLPLARSLNTAFTWSDVPAPVYAGKRKPGALRVMEAAQDHKYQNGLVIPFHYRDHLGAYYSSVCTLFWKDPAPAFVKRLRLDRYEMHMVLLYWAQRTIDIGTRTHRGGRFRDRDSRGYEDIYLTDRERDVLLWAAQGKTSEDTGNILGISRETVDEYIKVCLEKLDAANRTQAVVKAIYLGLIVP
ncbi:MAG: autoinducer binding domain-containing protein [Rhodobiaceae bacterium]|nr:autoinducer binding domain-containing protein [Rhodobiaceae bacterium]